MLKGTYFATDNPKNSEGSQLQQAMQNKVKGRVVGHSSFQCHHMELHSAVKLQIISKNSSTGEKLIPKWLVRPYLKDSEHLSNYRLQQNITGDWNVVTVATAQVKVRDNTWPDTVNKASESTDSNGQILVYTVTCLVFWGSLVRIPTSTQSVQESWFYWTTLNIWQAAQRSC